MDWARRVTWILFAMTMCAQTTLYRPGGGVSPPKVIRQIEAPYSQEARIARLEGSVGISLVIGADGAARDARVVRPLGLGLDEQAVSTIQKWRFAPGSKAGNAVAVETTFQLFFHVPRDVRDWHLEKVDFEVPLGASRPVITETKYPEPLGSDEEAGAVLVAFEVDEHGAVQNIAVGKSSDDKWEADVKGLLGKWRFTPAKKEGKPLAAECSFFFVRGSHAPIPLPH